MICILTKFGTIFPNLYTKIHKKVELKMFNFLKTNGCICPRYTETAKLGRPEGVFERGEQVGGGGAEGRRGAGPFWGPPGLVQHCKSRSAVSVWT